MILALAASLSISVNALASGASVSSATSLQAPTMAPMIAPSADPFFSSEEIFGVILRAPLAELFEKRSALDLFEAKKAVVPGTLEYGEVKVPVEIRMRGFSTLNVCNLPKMTIKIPKTSAAGTMFEHTRKLDLSTHCDPKPDLEDFVRSMKFAHREALVYRWLKILGIPGYETRMAKVTYYDTSKKTPLRIVTKPAFLIENLSSFLKRANGVEIRALEDTQHSNRPDNKERRAAYVDVPLHPQIDRGQLAIIAMFQAFIGNSDYFLSRNEIWNLKLIELKNGGWFPIPLDFNLANITVGEIYEGLALNNDFVGANKKLKLEIVAKFESKKAELYDSVTAIESDAIGAALFRKTLDAKYAALEALKKELSKAD